MLRYQPAKGLALLMSGVGLFVLLAAAVDAQVVNQVNGRHPVRQPDDAIAKISETWAKEWGAKNLEGVLALYAEDAVFLPSTGSRVTGRAAIRELFAGALASHSSKLQVRSKVTEHSGNLAFDSGEYDETFTSGGVTKSGRGQYLVVLRREGKDQWRIVQHIWTDLQAGQ